MNHNYNNYKCRNPAINVINSDLHTLYKVFIVILFIFGITLPRN
jgi:hypothetical protein